MVRSKALRIGLIAVFLTVLASILWSFLQRRQEMVVIPEGDLLPPEITRRTRHFEYSEQKEGRTVFRVEAEVSTEAEGSVHTLRNVKLLRYDETGKPSDTVAGEEAVYQIPNKRMEVSGNVQIELSDGTRILSRRVRADLEQEMVFIDEAFRFQRGDVEGQGQALVYAVAQKELRVSGSFQLALPAPSQRLQAEARRALYLLQTGRIDLEGKARISGAQGELKGDRIEIALTGDKKVERISSRGSARLNSAGQEEFSGNRIDLFFEPPTGEIRHFEVFGPPHAVYEKQLPEGTHYLEAERITGHVAASAMGLKRFVARDQVFFRSSALKIREARAALLTASFFDSRGLLERLELEGKVDLLREPPDPKLRRRERLRSDVLRIGFLPTGELENVRAGGGVDVELNSDPEYQHLWAGDSLEVHYQEGSPRRAVASGGCLLETRGAQGERVLRAPLMVADYEEGLPRQASAEGGVTLLLRPTDGPAQNMAARRLLVSYREGKPHQAIPSGDFHFWEERADGRTDLRSERAVYTLPQDRLVVTGTERPILEQGGSKTLADRFVVEQKQGKVLAEGQVRTVANSPEVMIFAGRMEMDLATGWVEYTEKPRILQGASSISGRRARFHTQDQSLVVEEQVQSVLADGNGTPGRSFSIAASRLVYEPQERMAHYQGEVRARTGEFEVEAPLLDVFFAEAEPGRVSEIIAHQGVRILQENRTAAGDRAVYTLSEEKIVLTGRPAQVIEEKSRSSGQRLTFYLHTNKILVEGSQPAARMP